MEDLTEWLMRRAMFPLSVASTTTSSLILNNWNSRKVPMSFQCPEGISPILILNITVWRGKKRSVHKTYIAVFAKCTVLGFPQVCNTSSHLFPTVLDNLQLKDVHFRLFHTVVTEFLSSKKLFPASGFTSIAYHFSFLNIPPCKEAPTVYTWLAKAGLDMFCSLKSYENHQKANKRSLVLS